MAQLTVRELLKQRRQAMRILRLYRHAVRPLTDKEHWGKANGVHVLREMHQRVQIALAADIFDRTQNDRG